MEYGLNLSATSWTPGLRPGGCDLDSVMKFSLKQVADEVADQLANQLARQLAS